jgi:hypothetical protein
MSTDKPQRPPRYPVRLSAEVRHGNVLTSGTTRNLSEAGVCVEIDRLIPETSPIGLRLFVVEDDVETEGARGLDLTGTVQWIAEADRGHAIGVKFDALTPPQARALENALKSITG